MKNQTSSCRQGRELRDLLRVCNFTPALIRVLLKFAAKIFKFFVSLVALYSSLFESFMSFLFKTTTTTSSTTTLIKRIFASSPFITSATTTSRKTMSALSRAGLPYLVGAATTTTPKRVVVGSPASPSINRFNNNNNNNNIARGDQVRTYAFGARKAPKGQLPEREPNMGLDPENAQAKVRRRHFLHSC